MISLSKNIAVWIRRKVAQGDISVSKFVGRMLEHKESYDYWRAYRHWKRDHTVPGMDAANRLSRLKAHERGRS